MGKKKGVKKEIVVGNVNTQKLKTEINLTDNRVEDEVRIALSTGLSIELPVLFSEEGFTSGEEDL